jgi:restriction endonuclease S subunit
MIRLSDVANIESGSPQFRIHESSESEATRYIIYDQRHLTMDKNFQQFTQIAMARTIQTTDKVRLTVAGEMIYSLISSEAAIVSKQNAGFLLTQNYVIIQPKDTVNKEYLFYLLNESTLVKRQLWTMTQGSQVLKNTLKSVRNLLIPNQISIIEQQKIGQLYVDMLKLYLLKRNKLNSERKLMLSVLHNMGDAK